MKIVIVGQNSQLGYDCIKVLESDHTVISTTSKEVDITSVRNSLDFIGKIEPDIILNCAAFTDVENSNDLREIAYKVNAYGANNLGIVSYCLGAKLIHISTDFVFDGKLEHPYEYVETDSCNPLNCYGGSKLNGEIAVKSFSNNYAIIRTSWLYGIHGHNFIKTILNKVLKDGVNEFSMISDQYGTPTSTISLAKQLKVIIENNLTGIIHASCNGSCTWYDFAVKIINLLNLNNVHFKPCSSSDYLSKVVRPSNSTLRNKVLQSQGLDIMPYWEEALEEFINVNKESLLG